jgi:hypothetical protein
METNSQLGGATTIPSELNGPLPRRVRNSPAGNRSAFLAVSVVAVALAGTCWLSMRGVHELQNRVALSNQGVEAICQITGFSHAGRHNGILVVQYACNVNGVSFSGKADVPTQSEREVNGSSSLRVRFLPANPAVNHPADWEESIYSIAVPLMFPMLPIAVGIMMLVSDHKERRLLAQGLPAIATTTKFYSPSGSWQSSRRGDQRVRYEFRTRDGDIYTGSIPFDDSQQVGSTLCILYLPQNPRQNLPYPQDDYRIAD